MTTSTSRRSSSSHRRLRTAVGSVHVVASTRHDGDFHPGRVAPDVLHARRQALVALPWTMLDEVHGIEVRTVDHPGDADGARGDVAVTDVAGAALAVWAGDCAPIALVADDGRFAVAHAGWRGLAAGVLETAWRAVHGKGGPSASPARVAAVLGPCIGPCCYEFTPADIDVVAAGLGLDVARITGRTTWGATALDVPSAVRASLGRHGVPVHGLDACTGCGGEHFSHRVGRDPRRHVLVAWRDA